MVSTILAVMAIVAYVVLVIYLYIENLGYIQCWQYYRDWLVQSGIAGVIFVGAYYAIVGALNFIGVQ